jgi:Uma2 family endonuclease
MNDFMRHPKQHPTTQAAEGVPRLCWSLDEFDRLTEVGIFAEDDRIELIGGELVPMQAKGARHELVKTKLLNWFMRRLPEDLELTVELGWRPGGDMYLEPDIVIYRCGESPAYLQPEDALLVIEIADASLAYDRGHKAEIYAKLGVRDYWVVDANGLVTVVHRDPSSGGFGSAVEVAADEPLVPLQVAPLALKLGQLGLD